jgi:4-hydroxy 2-oxovalerate aldolase
LAAVLTNLGITSGIDVLKIFDAAEDVVLPVMGADCVLDRMSLIMGYAGVYSSFLKHAYRAADRYRVSGAEILLECGRQSLVGGQEDQIIQIAADLGRRRELQTSPGTDGR